MGSLWNRSGTVERYADDLRATGAKAYFYQGGTTTPLTVYQDAGEAAAHPHPVVADANGRWPDIFVPYISGYDARVVSRYDVLLSFSQQIPNPNPVDVTVNVDDPLQVVQTGMTHFEFVNTTRPGYVRLNGKTMGNAASGGTERANTDTQALYIHLWDNLADAVAPVLGGRGGSAASDFTANKPITLPNMRGAIPVGLDDMGSTAGGYFTGLGFDTGSPTVPGSAIGTNAVVLTETNLPPHTHSGTTNADTGHIHGGTTGDQSQSHTHTGTAASDGAHQHDAFIGDDGHFHNVTFFYSSGVATAQAGGGLAVNLLNQNTSNNTTGVKVRSSAGNAATADNKVASGGAHTHSISTGNANQGHTHNITTDAGTGHTHTFTTGNGSGVSAPVNNLPRSLLVTWYIRL